MFKVSFRWMGMLGLLASVWTSAWGVGMDNNAVGSRGMTMVSALTAVADDASAVFYNPAGLAMIPDEKFSLDAYVLMLNTDYNSTPAGGTKLSSTDPAVIPGLFVSKTFKDFGVGFGCYIPYGGAYLHYKDYPMPGYEYKTYMGVFAFAPSLGYRLLSNLSVGATAEIYYGLYSTKFDAMQTELNLSGLAGVGVNLGVLYQPAETWNLGLTYKAPAVLKYKGTTKSPYGTFDSDIQMNMPPYLKLGVAKHLSSDLLLAFDVWYMMWSNMDKVTFTTNGNATESKTNYKNSVMTNLAAEYRLIPALTLRGGVRYVQGGTKDEGISAMNIDLDNISAGLGAGITLTPGLDLNLSGFYSFSLPKEVDNVKYANKVTGFLGGITAKF